MKANPGKYHLLLSGSDSSKITKWYGIETASSISPKLWENVPTEIKNPKALEELTCELKVRFPKAVLARYVNCSLNM